MRAYIERNTFINNGVALILQHSKFQFNSSLLNSAPKIISVIYRKAHIAWAWNYNNCNPSRFAIRAKGFNYRLSMPLHPLANIYGKLIPLRFSSWEIFGNARILYFKGSPSFGEIELHSYVVTLHRDTLQYFRLPFPLFSLIFYTKFLLLPLFPIALKLRNIYDKWAYKHARWRRTCTKCAKCNLDAAGIPF